MFSGPIEDRLGIRERFDSYSDAVTRQVLNDYLDCLSQMAFMTQIGAIVIDRTMAANTVLLSGDSAISRRHHPSAHREL
ncbi:hypothetical protein ORI20_04195 [Mycobacterium sp. CVI_P3]|uniref:Uncharacterized protein n=1 Tax=Mycobacterium pinniadriaticum TaxID=2994102 RepID=A0ABT3S8R2_9MYCO|nr:hypothetical protein [Mycobacterium pinniadriaticum]MCX2929461.1 hypothetical protein [Mycobacterium pinniadriaticum]MCX2935885.1 hypothetical protein [Mycobacterium pinniadriaticum]